MKRDQEDDSLTEYEGRTEKREEEDGCKKTVFGRTSFGQGREGSTARAGMPRYKKNDTSSGIKAWGRIFKRNLED